MTTFDTQQQLKDTSLYDAYKLVDEMYADRKISDERREDFIRESRKLILLAIRDYAAEDTHEFSFLTYYAERIDEAFGETLLLFESSE